MRRPRAAPVVFATVFIALYVALLTYTRGLTFPLDRDEAHFWPTSLAFAHALVDPLSTYQELNTPLPFVIDGQLARVGVRGLQLARALNMALSAAVLLLIAYAPGRITWSSTLAAVGLISCAYFIGFATHVYTDTIAIACVVFAMWWHRERRDVAAAIAWALAIASRQTTVAFPAAIAAWELTRRRTDRHRPARRWAAPVVGVVSLLPWIAFFRGLVPPHAVANYPAGEFGRLYPDHALYLLVGVGAYYAVPEALLFRRTPIEDVRRSRLIVMLAALAIAFVAAPPVANPLGAQMGLVDAAAHAICDPWPLATLTRLVIFWMLAGLAVARVSQSAILCWLVAANAIVALAVPVAWDKYAVPLLAVMWLLRASADPTSEATEIRSPRG